MKKALNDQYTHNLLHRYTVPTALLFVLTATVSFQALANATGTIKGRVIDIHNQGIAAVNLRLEGTTIGTVSDSLGYFIIKNIPAGPYFFKATSDGFKPFYKPITLKNGEKVTLSFQLSRDTNHLKPIIVRGQKKINHYVEKLTGNVAKMQLTRMGNPQSYTTITHGLLTQQMAISYKDIYKNISGTMIPLQTANGRPSISLRGFETESETKDGVSSLDYFPIGPSDIEKIEVIKGPSATLYGNQQSSYGGIINIITKKPYDHFGGELSSSFGSFGLARVTADLNAPLNKKHTVLFRINAAGEHKNSFKDAGFYKNIFVAPSFSWKISKKLDLVVRSEYYNFVQPSPFEFVPYSKTKINNVKDLGMDPDKSFNPNNIPNKGKQYNLHFILHENLFRKWTGRTDLVANHVKKGGYKLSFNGVSDSTLRRNVEKHPNVYEDLEVQQNFNNTEKFGGFENKLLIGLDFSTYLTKKRKSSISFDTVNFKHPGRQYYDLTKEAVNKLNFNLDKKATSIIQNTYAVYGSDLITFDKRLSAMVSFRLDRFQNKSKSPDGKITDQYGQTALSSKYGLVYQLIPRRLSIFGNYMTGFQNVHGYNYYGQPFKPQNASQTEVGVKLNLIRHRVTGRISVYNISVTHILRGDPEHIDYSIQNGSELSQGMELEIKANPVRRLNLLAGYSFNHFEYKNINDALNGRRSPESGPGHTANLWISYKLPANVTLGGLGFGFGANYGSQQEEVVRFTAHRFYRPAYALFDATVFYAHKFYRISVKADNLSNEKYWNARLDMGEPRSILGQITISF